VKKNLSNDGENEEWHEYADSEHREKPELGFFIQRLSHLIGAQTDYYVLCLPIL